MSMKGKGRYSNEGTVLQFIANKFKCSLLVGNRIEATNSKFPRLLIQTKIALDEIHPSRQGLLDMLAAIVGGWRPLVGN